MVRKLILVIRLIEVAAVVGFIFFIADYWLSADRTRPSIREMIAEKTGHLPFLGRTPIEVGAVADIAKAHSITLPKMPSNTDIQSSLQSIIHALEKVK